MKIFIDAGHGGNDPGAFANNIKEKDINLSVSLELRKLLLENGFEVVMSRDIDATVGLETRCLLANQSKADVFISIHHNAGGGDGFEVIHTIHTQYSQGDEIANSIGNEFSKLGQNIRKIYARESTNYPNQDYYTVIQNTAMPAIITEYAFIDNSNDVQAVDTYIELIAEATAIFKGLCNYYNINLSPIISDDSKIKLLQQTCDYLSEKIEQIKKVVL